MSSGHARRDVRQIVVVAGRSAKDLDAAADVRNRTRNGLTSIRSYNWQDGVAPEHGHERQHATVEENEDR